MMRHLEMPRLAQLALHYLEHGNAWVTGQTTEETPTLQPSG
jgi:hypothetical protein